VNFVGFGAQEIRPQLCRHSAMHTCGVVCGLHSHLSSNKFHRLGHWTDSPSASGIHSGERVSASVFRCHSTDDRSRGHRVCPWWAISPCPPARLGPCGPTRWFDASGTSGGEVRAAWIKPPVGRLQERRNLVSEELLNFMADATLHLRHAAYAVLYKLWA